MIPRVADMISFRIKCVLAAALTAGLLLASCSLAKRAEDNHALANTAGSNLAANAVPINSQTGNSADGGANSTIEKTTTSNAVARAACMNVDPGEKRAVQKSQTFAIDFEPFKGSCFVTSYNPEYGDSHMGTDFSIYKSGKKTFSLPNQFNGSTFGCWVDAVAFQDLNRDGLTDVIVIGKCSAKGGDYNENMIYVNTGRTFTTSQDGNNQLSDFNTTKEVIGFVEDNKQIFFK
jgi:hypothetical protein